MTSWLRHSWRRAPRRGAGGCRRGNCCRRPTPDPSARRNCIGSRANCCCSPAPRIGGRSVDAPSDRRSRSARRPKSGNCAPTTSLARLLRKQGRIATRRARCCAEIYNWFTEGFDTADLKDAKALLDELESKRKCAVQVRYRKSARARSSAPNAARALAQSLPGVRRR